MRRTRTQISIVVVGTLLVADFIWFGYLPSKERLEVLDRSRVSKLAMVSKANAERLKLPDLKKRINRYTEKAEAHYDRVPKQKEVGRFIQSVSLSMKKHEIQRQMILPKSEVTAGSLKGIPVMIQGYGHLSQFYGLLQDINALDRIARMKTIRFDNDEHLQGRVYMEAVFVIYYQPQGNGEESELAGTF